MAHIFLSTNNKCSITNELFYALNMNILCDSLSIYSVYCALRWSAVFRQTRRTDLLYPSYDFLFI